jgi:hypothetical protein
MNSDTSSDVNINYLDNENNKMGDNTLPKKESSETDMYLNLIANPSKIAEDEPNSTTSLQLDESETNKISTSSIKNSSVSSQVNFETVKLGNSDTNRKQSKKTSRKKSRNSSIRSNLSSRVSSRKSEVNVTPNIFEEPEVVLTPQQIKFKKTELLRKLSELKQKGYKLTQEYSFNSTIEEMESEYELLKSIADKRNGLKLYKNLLLNACSVAEFLNDKYDPFSFQLSGWSEHMSVEVDSYEDVLEELYEKYKGKGTNLPPEMKLLFLIVASASAFHFSKAHLSKMPGMDKVAQKAPSMINKMFNSNQQSKQNFMSPDEIRIEEQKKQIQEKERILNERIRQNRINQQTPISQPNYISPDVVTSLPEMTPINTAPVNLQRTVKSEKRSVPQKQFTSLTTPTTNIKASQSVQDILNKLHSRDENAGTETQDESSVNNDRIVSDTMSETRRKKKKNLMVIN